MTLSGPAAACVTGVTMRGPGGTAQPVPFTLRGTEGVTVTLPGGVMERCYPVTKTVDCKMPK